MYSLAEEAQAYRFLLGNNLVQEFKAEVVTYREEEGEANRVLINPL